MIAEIGEKGIPSESFGTLVTVRDFRPAVFRALLIDFSRPDLVLPFCNGMGYLSCLHKTAILSLAAATSPIDHHYCEIVEEI